MFMKSIIHIPKRHVWSCLVVCKVLIITNFFSFLREEESLCPICLMCMVEGESLVACEAGCRNQLHHHCMAVWAADRHAQGQPLLCPLCRAPWPLKHHPRLAPAPPHTAPRPPPTTSLSPPSPAPTPSSSSAAAPAATSSQEFTYPVMSASFSGESCLL